jgi:hypothetical protein
MGERFEACLMLGAEMAACRELGQHSEEMRLADRPNSFYRDLWVSVPVEVDLP